MTVTTDLLPARDTAATIQHLINCGMTMEGIARAAGCHSNTVSNARKAGARVTIETADRIAAVRATISPNALVPAFGATRRIRAAAAEGHTEVAFAKQARLKLPYISELTTGSRSLIFASTHERVDIAYRTLLAGPAPTGRGASRARNRARAAGWPTPEQWDGEIDNPDADPQAWMRNDTSRNFEDLAEDSEFIIRTTGASLAQAAARLGVSRDTLWKARKELAA